MKKIINAPIIDPFSGDPFTMVSETGDQQPLDCIMAARSFLNNGFRGDKAPSLKDSHHAMRVYEALRKTKSNGNSVVKLEDADYDWFISAFEARGTSVFHINAAAILAGFRRVDEGDKQEE